MYVHWGLRERTRFVLSSWVMKTEEPEGTIKTPPEKALSLCVVVCGCWIHSQECSGMSTGAGGWWRTIIKQQGDAMGIELRKVEGWGLPTRFGNAQLPAGHADWVSTTQWMLALLNVGMGTLTVEPSWRFALKQWLPNNGVESLENEELIKISCALSAVKREERVVPQGHILISDAQCALPYSLKKQIFPRYRAKLCANRSQNPVSFRRFSCTRIYPAMA